MNILCVFATRKEREKKSVHDGCGCFVVCVSVVFLRPKFPLFFFWSVGRLRVSLLFQFSCSQSLKSLISLSNNKNNNNKLVF